MSGRALLSAHSVTSLDVVHHADALAFLRGAPSNWLSCVVTSPPYFQQRRYTNGDSREIGLEDTPERYVARLIDLFRELRRVMRDDSTAWLNLGDTHLPGKQLAGIPWRVALAMQADGWVLRSDIIWSRPNPMPESVRDRPTKSHEYIFLLTKNARYWYDADAIAEPSGNTSGWARQRQQGTNTWKYNDRDDRIAVTGQRIESSTFGDMTTRNKRTVWTVPTSPSALPHFAMFPQALIEPMVLAGCPAQVCAVCGAPYERVVERVAATPGQNPGYTAGTGMRNDGGRAGHFVDMRQIDWGFEPTCSCDAETRPGIVFDPFMGSGTTALVAQRLGRHFVGTDINREYVELARTRLRYRGDDRRMVREQEAGVEQLSLLDTEAA